MCYIKRTMHRESLLEMKFQLLAQIKRRFVEEHDVQEWPFSKHSSVQQQLPTATAKPIERENS